MLGGEHPEKPISLFYSYSHRDEKFRDELETHLAFLRRGDLITEWHDRKIDVGEEWKGAIDRNFAAADIVLLLVSADFIASDYCWREEMTKALVRQQRGEVRIIPIILRHCQWRRTPLGSLQAVPKDGRPVSDWPDRDAAFDSIAATVYGTVADLRQQRREEERREAEARAAREAEELRREEERREAEARAAREAEELRREEERREAEVRAAREAEERERQWRAQRSAEIKRQLVKNEQKKVEWGLLARLSAI